MSKIFTFAGLTVGAAVVATAVMSTPAAAGFAARGASAIPQLQHIIIIVQENRSFDSYFGTYPGANGIPMSNGKPTICNPDPNTGKCVASFHNRSDINAGGPHDPVAFRNDLDGGKVDGFITTARNYPDPDAVMGYHDVRELSNYWAYAQQYVLQDAMFAPSTAYSLPEHLYLISNWSALCTFLNDPASCSSSFLNGGTLPGSLGWTDITWLLHNRGVSWRYYVFGGQSADVINPADDDGVNGEYVRQDSTMASQWNPLPAFSDVVADNQLKNVVNGHTFYADAANGKLPSVSWVVPDSVYSEHPPSRVSAGMKYVSGLVNAAMSGPDWNTTAIFITWDEWGGLFDHVTPPVVDWGGYGFRVPGLVVSPWALHGVVDHQTLSFDAYNKLIEDLFLGSRRLDPTTDGRPDPRPDVRENYSGLGDLLNDFDFSQRLRRPMIMRDALQAP
jgi:phospholipase C